MPPTLELSVRDALRWSTIGGAAALGMDSSVGSLAVGKQADIVVLSTYGPALLPAPTHPEAAILQAGPGDVDTVIVAGRVVKHAGHLVGIDLTELGQEAARERSAWLLRAGEPPQYTPAELRARSAEFDELAARNLAVAFSARND